MFGTAREKQQYERNPLNIDDQLNQQLSTARGTPGIFVFFSSGKNYYNF
jgi:hypothetical protein